MPAVHLHMQRELHRRMVTELDEESWSRLWQDAVRRRLDGDVCPHRVILIDRSGAKYSCEACGVPMVVAPAT